MKSNPNTAVIDTAIREHIDAGYEASSADLYAPFGWQIDRLVDITKRFRKDDFGRVDLGPSSPFVESAHVYIGTHTQNPRLQLELPHKFKNRTRTVCYGYGLDKNGVAVLEWFADDWANQAQWLDSRNLQRAEIEWWIGVLDYKSRKILGARAGRKS